MEGYSIRAANRSDVSEILRFIHLIAEREKSEVYISDRDLGEDGFGREPWFWCLVVEETSPELEDVPTLPTSASQTEHGAVATTSRSLVGIAFFFFLYSTWEGRVMFIDDIFVDPAHRGRGCGTALLQECAKIATVKDCRRFCLDVLRDDLRNQDWYRRLGATLLPGWIWCHFHRESLNKLAGEVILPGNVTIRQGTKEDVKSIHFLIQLLAEYEKEPHSVKIADKEYLRDGFEVKDRYYHCLLVETTVPLTCCNDTASACEEDAPSTKMEHNNKIIGMAIFCRSYCTFRGRVLHLEDLFVRKEYRNQGIGTALLKSCAKEALSWNCSMLTLQVLDWNTKAHALYSSLGASTIHEYIPVRFCRQEIDSLGKGTALK